MVPGSVALISVALVASATSLKTFLTKVDWTVSSDVVPVRVSVVAVTLSLIATSLLKRVAMVPPKTSFSTVTNAAQTVTVRVLKTTVVYKLAVTVTALVRLNKRNAWAES